MLSEENVEQVELLSAQDIMAANDIVFEIVEVPEWGGKVRVKALTATERDDFESEMLVGEGKKQRVTTKNIRAHLVARTVVDSSGSQIFSLKQVGLLGMKSAAAMDRVYEVAARISKITQEDVEELAGDLKEITSEDS